jgi:hypothetical protein
LVLQYHINAGIDITGAGKAIIGSVLRMMREGMWKRQWRVTGLHSISFPKYFSEKCTAGVDSCQVHLVWNAIKYQVSGLYFSSIATEGHTKILNMITCSKC